jgi:VanZ family protein
MPIFPWGKFGIHLSFFTVLALLANATCWPKRPWWILIAVLILYGITTETLQLLVPHRSAQVIDAIENILGIALGTAIYGLALRLTRRWRRAAPASRALPQAFNSDR